MEESDNVKDTLCRNVMIYGHCRYEEKGLLFAMKVPSRF